MFQHTKLRYIYRFQNLSLGFILQIFLKLGKFQPRYNLVKKLSVQFSRPAEIRKMPDNAKRNITKPSAEHPKYEEMIKTAICTLKDRNGSWRQAMEKYIKANCKMGDTPTHHIKTTMKKGSVVREKGVGTSKCPLQHMWRCRTHSHTEKRNQRKRKK